MGPVIATTWLRDFQLCATSVKTGERLFKVGEKDRGEYSKKILGQVNTTTLTMHSLSREMQNRKL